MRTSAAIGQACALILAGKPVPDPATPASVWISYQGTEMQPVSIYTEVVELTESRLGKRLNPHLFRDCAATSIAFAQPDNMQIVAAIRLPHDTGSQRTALHSLAVRAACGALSGIYRHIARQIGTTSRHDQTL